MATALFEVMKIEIWTFLWNTEHVNSNVNCGPINTVETLTSPFDVILVGDDEGKRVPTFTFDIKKNHFR
jgi:hypothetical protein